MAHDVFISYSSKDKITADAVCATLEQNGVRCWIAPRDILPGMEYGEALIEALHSSKLLVLVFSSGANASLQVRQEVERAVSRAIPILPFRIEDVPPNRAMELYISGRHWLDALTPPLEAHLNELARTVKLLLSRSEEPPTLIPPPKPGLGQTVPDTKDEIPAPAAIPFSPKAESEPQISAANRQAPTPPAANVPNVTATAKTPQAVPAAAAAAIPLQRDPTIVVPAPAATLPKWLVMTEGQALKHIRNAWIVGLISVAITIIVILVAESGGTPIAGIPVNWSNLIDVALMLALAIGTYKRNQWCAVGLFVLFVIEKIYQWSVAGVGNAFAVILSIVFLYFFFQGMRGGLAYNMMKGVRTEPAPAS